MNNISGIKQLFSVLGQRLFYFESGDYITTARLFISYEEENDLATSIISSIEQGFNLYNLEDVYQEVEVYLIRVKSVIAHLGFTKFEEIEYDFIDPNYLSRNFEIRETNDERKKELKDIHKTELEKYEKALQRILNIAKPFYETSLIGRKDNMQVIQEIVLPEFGVAALQKHFNPSLTIEQAALFLYYLKEQNIVPNYSNSTMGKLAEYMFARHEKGVRDKYAQFHELRKSKEDLDLIQSILAKIISSIERDKLESK